MFTCEQCNYSTKVKCNFTKHLNRQVKCCPKTSEKINTDIKNINVEDNNINVDETNINVDDINKNKIKCLKCEKILSKKYFNEHTKLCKGIPKNTCEFCLHRYVCRQSKYQHQKRCKMNPENIPEVLEKPATPSGLQKNNITNDEKEDPRIKHAIKCLMDIIYEDQDKFTLKTVMKINL